MEKDYGQGGEMQVNRVQRERGLREARHPATTRRYSSTREQLRGWSWQPGGRGKVSDGDNRKLEGEGYRTSNSQEFKKKVQM